MLISVHGERASGAASSNPLQTAGSITTRISLAHCELVVSLIAIGLLADGPSVNQALTGMLPRLFVSSPADLLAD